MSDAAATDKIPRPTIEDIEKLGESFLALVREAGEWGDGEVQAAAREVARAVLRETDPDRIEVVLPVRWRTGCHCHGDRHATTLDAEDPTSLGAQLAEHSHADDADIEEAYWRVPLSAEEKGAVRIGYRARRDAMERVARAEHALSLSLAREHALLRGITEGEARLAELRPELNAAATVAREDALRALRDQLAKQKGVTTQCRAALAEARK